MGPVSVSGTYRPVVPSGLLLGLDALLPILTILDTPSSVPKLLTMWSGCYRDSRGLKPTSRE